MWISNIEIHDFRAFQNYIDIELSQNITCISGHNGIGKSTILAILSNCGELKKDDAKHINGSLFRGEFSDIIVGDREYDTTGEKAILTFQNVPKINAEITDRSILVDKLHFRALFQKERYRLLPLIIEGKRETESKLKWPTYYLGLSRLYPVGEAKTKSRKNLPRNIETELITLHKEILSLDFGDNLQARTIGIQEVSRHKTGFKSNQYSDTANSSGQDNVGQIILSVLSFKKLKEKDPSNYHGGILLIDELDATLHPAAQRKLFDYLYQQSVELKLQIVFTTHSLSLLEYITLTRQKKKNTTNIKISYLTRRSDGVHEKANPSKEFFINDLNDTYTGAISKINKVKVLTEDSIARWFIKELFDFKKFSPSIDLLDINISWSHIINLVKSDIETFKNYITILDPDINKTENISSLRKMIIGLPLTVDEPLSNILILPGTSPNYPNIEKMLWEYIDDIPDTHQFFDDPIISDRNWTKRLVMRDGPESERYKTYDDTMKYKKWFEENRYFIEILMKYWVNDNEEIVTEFVDKFKSIYGKISKDINV
ncbi:AAA family ATPase [Enterococcus faecium]|uniref:ATP-dependent nuclease n=1 Tax=Enterococcus faecium TaxID=1352 RepID=UPI0023314E23|nr:AAA family ATPase [Enterococcus faecium]WCG11215.1 AAA family ATPase [Enterococcus faecium]HDI5789748.1 AAA family ATPase [Enterococcus faecium]